MVLNKQFITLGIFALVIGLTVGVVPFYREFSLLKTYTMEYDVVYAYFRIHTVNENATGLRNVNLVSYVIVLNITNPTDEPIKIMDLRILFVENATRTGQSIQMRNTAIEYQRDFSDHNMDNYFYPNSPRLIALGAAGEISNLGLQVLNNGKGFFYINIAARTQGNAYVKTDIVIKEITLEVLNDQEFVYNTIFKENELFHFSNEDLDISLEW